VVIVTLPTERSKIKCTKMRNKCSVEEIHSVGMINNVETSYFTQLKMCYLMTTFRCPSDILITSWLFTAWWSTWPGNHLVPCVAELVGSCILIHARQCLTDPKCLFYPSGLSLCLSVDHFCLVPVDDMVLFHGMVCDGWFVSYTALPCSGGSSLCTSCERVHFFLVFSWSLDQTSCLSLQHKSWSSSCKGHDRSIKKAKNTRGNHKGMVVVPYVKGLSKAFARILKSHGIATANRPHRTLRNFVVHPKDKVRDEEKTELICCYKLL